MTQSSPLQAPTLQEGFQQLRLALQTQIIGQPILVERLLLTLLADGHLLVEGAPGLAKTKAINALADHIEGEFKRVQFTPDLLPGDSGRVNPLSLRFP